MPRSSFRAALRAGTVTMVAGGFAVASALTPADAVTTSAKPVRQVPVTNLQSMTISNNGSLYVVNSSSIDVWSPSSDGIPDVTKTITGANVSGFPSLKEGTGLAYASSGASVVVINPGQAAGAAVPIRTISGAATKIVEEFLTAALSGDTEPLIRLLTDDAVSVADGGGRIPARKTPIVGALGIARFLRGLFRPTDARRAQAGGSPALHAVVVNGGPAVLVEVGERILGVLCLEATADGVAAIRSQVNPEKLERITRQWAAEGPHRPLVEIW